MRMSAIDTTESTTSANAKHARNRATFAASDTFVHRHIGPNEAEIADMLAVLGYDSLERLSDAVVPESIRLDAPLDLGRERGEDELLAELKAMADTNIVSRSCIGQGYYDCITPPVILRNILENPGWYTQYTPYQAEIAQGRLEALLNYQTMVADLTGLPIANSSLLDEPTAAAEAMAMCYSISRQKKGAFFVAADCHPQTIAVVRTRAESIGIELIVGQPDAIDFDAHALSGILLQYPNTRGAVRDYTAIAEQSHAAGAMVVVATDLLALTLLKPPGEWGADIAVGSAQRFGVPMGAGGPHAAFISCIEKHVRKLPGRIVGVSKDSNGNPAYRLAIQTREQHIKRERATSNICTAQVLLAIIASMYAVYHGPAGLKRIAQRVHGWMRVLVEGLKRMDVDVQADAYFDTITAKVKNVDALITIGGTIGINLRKVDDETIGVSFDETTTQRDVEDVLDILGTRGGATAEELITRVGDANSDHAKAALLLPRESDYLTHSVFNRYHSETEMLRYIKKLESRDLSLTHSMISLGSCTMKLNGTSEMIPVTWPSLGKIHPYVPAEQVKGYTKLCDDLERWLCACTGFDAMSLQPNAGSQGEYAGLLAIRGYHQSRGDQDRTVCLIPVSAHGTNPASAVIAGFEVVPVACDKHGNVDVADLRDKAALHADKLGALMITYPSTHGVFEPSVREVVDLVHEHGGQVYMDGANMNAQVGLTSPGAIGADVCHLNLHKTFCIPHGGGGPGMGPIGVAKHLAPFLPSDPNAVGSEQAAVGPVSAARWGSASILPISWVYIALMGGEGLKRATQVAILNANYMANRLAAHYPVVYAAENGTVAHEFIIDCRQFKQEAGVEIDDIAKRLMDYGFHAPTMSFPVPGTLMIEPTESESKAELDRLCDALIAIRQEIRDIEEGTSDSSDNALKFAPHTAGAVASDDWQHAYSREQAGYPVAWVKEHKFWPYVGRIDNPYGDRNLFCTCVPMGEG
jgi:glycine dehydrogenase